MTDYSAILNAIGQLNMNHLQQASNNNRTESRLNDELADIVKLSYITHNNHAGVEVIKENVRRKLEW